MNIFLSLICSIGDVFIDFASQIVFLDFSWIRPRFVMDLLELLWFHVPGVKAELEKGELERFEGVVENSKFFEIS